jgi:hypothetical protein
MGSGHDEAGGNAGRAYGAVGVIERPRRLDLSWENDTTCRSMRMPELQTRLLDFGPAPKAKPRSTAHPLGREAGRPNGNSPGAPCSISAASASSPEAAPDPGAPPKERSRSWPPTCCPAPPQERGSLQRKRSANRILQPPRGPRRRCVLTRDRGRRRPGVSRNPPQTPTPSKSCRTLTGWARRRAGRGDAKSLVNRS